MCGCAVVEFPGVEINLSPLVVMAQVAGNASSTMAVAASVPVP